MNSSNLYELLNVEFGEVGTLPREEFDKEIEVFFLAQTHKKEHKCVGLL